MCREASTGTQAFWECFWGQPAKGSLLVSDIVPVSP